MSFDWKKLDRDQRERDARFTPWMGAAWLISGLGVLLIGALTGTLGKSLVPSIFWLILGGATIAVGMGLRKRNRVGGDQLKVAEPDPDHAPREI